jgi:hypothetical protein
LNGNAFLINQWGSRGKKGGAVREKGGCHEKEERCFEKEGRRGRVLWEGEPESPKKHMLRVQVPNAEGDCLNKEKKGGAQGGKLRELEEVLIEPAKS